MPQALFLGEEAVSADRRLLEDLPQAELTIVCDPVDGTWNFAGLSLLTFASRKPAPADACLR